MDSIFSHPASTTLSLHPAGVLAVGRYPSTSHKKTQATRIWLKRQVDAGRLVRIFDGAFAVTSAWQRSEARDALVALAVGLTHRGDSVTGRAAALLHGLAPFNPVSCIDVLTTAGVTHRRSTISPAPLAADDTAGCATRQWSLRFHRVRSHRETSQDAHSVRFTTVTSTLIHIARHLPALDGFPEGGLRISAHGRGLDLSCPTADISAVLKQLDKCFSDGLFMQYAECLAMAESAIRGEVGGAGGASGLGGASELGGAGGASGAFHASPGCPRPLPATGQDLVVLRRDPISRSTLLETCSQQRRSPGKQRAETLLRHASELSESPFESMTKLLLIVLGINFVQQARIVNEQGKVVARVDFLLQDYGVIVETDGLAKYDSSAKVRADRTRDFRLTNLGYAVCHLTWKDVSTLKAIQIIANTIQRQATQAEKPRGAWFPSHFRLPSSYYQWDK